MKAFLSLLVAALSLQLEANTSIKITTSIKPVSMVVKAIGGDEISLTQIVSNSASPHDFALRPSDLKKVEQADFVVWVGGALEPFLVKPLKNTQPADSTIEWLALIEGAKKAGTYLDQHEKKAVNKLVHTEKKPLHFSNHGRHHHGELDPHVWLDAENSLLLAESVLNKLVQLAPEKRDYFQQNMSLFEQALARVEQENTARLAPMKAVKYVVFHDAYGGFESHYGLKHVANISLSPERKPGAKRIVSIRTLMQKNEVACVFSEPQFNPAIITALTQGTSVKVVSVDPLGIDIELNQQAYPAFLQQLGQQFSQCL